MDFKEYMTYESLKNLREHHPAWRLLASDNASFILSFFYKEFVLPNHRKLPEHILISKLENHMELIPHIRDNNKRAKDYLVEWSDDSFGWLRRFYPKNEEEIHYDLSSSAEKAIEWLLSLKPESFIGTESRLIMVFDLLEQIISGTQTDPELKLKELEKKKEQLEKEIELVKKGDIRNLEPTQIKERFLQASHMAREILSDFRAVEQNFRELNRDMREKIAKWDRSKGELIGDYFSEQNDIYQSDQGRSFDAFFNFIMSSDARTHFDETIEELKKIETLSNIVEQSGMEDIVSDWLEGSNQVWNTVETMSEQLRRYVDESYLDEEKRINQLIKNIEIKALELRGELLKQNILEIDEVKADIRLPMDRNLFSPPRKVELLDEDIDYGTAQETEDSLYSHIYVDKEKLIANIRRELMHRNEIGLGEIIKKYPLKYGLTELTSYFALGQKVKLKSEDGQYEYIEYENLESERVRAKIPKIIYLGEEQKN
ncbi:MAG: DUF3375 domain-containing protein [Peptostreptococcaceae bacterium]|nr:DUF3375 domain-containing protein [Peptostreptococcaceae bacterium]